MTYDQDPAIIFNAILPLYLNGQILRMLQVSTLASHISDTALTHLALSGVHRG